IGPAHQVVDGPDAVPAFDAGRRVSQRLPPPPALPVGAMVNAGYLAKLQRVDDEADVAIPRAPDSMVLKSGLVAVAVPAGVAADVEDGGQLALDFLRAVEIPGHVQPRPALEVEFLDNEVISFDCAGDRGLQRRLLRQRPQAKHVEVFLVQPRTTGLPLLHGCRTVAEAL